MMSGGTDKVFRRRVVERVAYGTITIMCVLVVYDGWSQLKLLGVLGVIVGPIVAMFISHLFASSLAQQIDLGRTLNRAERIGTVRSESRFMLVAVPPAVLAVVLSVSGVSLALTIRIILCFGVGTLGFWGGLAGRRAGFTGWHLVLAVLTGLAVGLLVLAIEIFLQPGKAVVDGVA
jgi:hypothetical protein